MRKKSGPINKRVDFLSNRLNKYSIRKFTIGTASILVGSTLIFGIGSGEAKADEKVYTNNENGTKSKHEKSEVESAPEAKATENVQETNKVESAQQQDKGKSVEANEKSFYDLSKKIDQAVNKKEVVEKQVKKQFSSVLSEKK
ncbi:TPA: YSIRK-type signal peptide-containing protein [Staphylococcus aureus]|uniref:YSIRK-type signal peptide-containing protein n=1 Tax=Staphylococcus aureus TaxID=1280 RepID=UPI000E3E9DC3|nr:MSCRAMM family adhesin SdrC [Staphylococcus aureus]MCG9350451.1 MSCRAMM family adhesin SdrC [Staphylococcus aureus]HAR4936102.1 YSIRK-type signal peptide-containing protein [Staphylococcus aureus]HAR5579157.1 YSIRK-type signal peptide-containing protein [Staphylococcus aureus]HCV0306337.1 YSIRK-type signal peptide-containing protein [Staphylococcus aureus]